MSDGSSGTICSDGWSMAEARIVCRQLGLGYAQRAITESHFLIVRSVAGFILACIIMLSYQYYFIAAIMALITLTQSCSIFQAHHISVKRVSDPLIYISNNSPNLHSRW